MRKRERERERADAVQRKRENCNLVTISGFVVKTRAGEQPERKRKTADFCLEERKSKLHET